MSQEKPFEVTCGELRDALAGGRVVHLIDCREPSEYEVVRLAGATLVPMAETPARVAELAALDGDLVVYCHHGFRSAQTANWLRAHGIPHAQSLAGGIDRWATEIDPALPRY